VNLPIIREGWRIQNEGLIPEPVKRTRSLRLDRNEGCEYVQEVERLRHDENSTLACTADYVMLLLLLGSRRVETMRLRWSDADFDDRVIKFRPENVKNGKLLVLPLEPWAEQILIDRKRKNAERGLATGPQDWIFSSRRRSKRQAAEIEAAKLENREPATWARGVTHISSTIEILDLLQARIGRWTSLHDIQRTVAGALTLAKDALEETSKSLNHSPARQFAQTKTYVPPHDMIKMLRKLFAKHEKNMRVFAGLLTVEAAEGEKALKPEQQVILEAAMKMLEDAKVSPEQLRRKLEID